jgi:hypothetical protein
MPPISPMTFMGKSPSYANSNALFEGTIYLPIQPFLSLFIAPVSSREFKPGWHTLLLTNIANAIN